MTSSKHILVVDDDPGILATVADILTYEGYSVELAGNGAEGLKLLERDTPRLVLLDMRMPILDGWEFAQRLKEMQISVPIVVMTAAQDAGQWAEEIGASGVVPKPFDLMELLSAVEDAMAS